MDRPINNEKTDVVFEFNDMRSVYNEGITVLLKKVVNNPSVAYRLADFIANQVVVGTVVACEGENDVYGFGTIIPIYRQKSNAASGSGAVTVQSLMNAPCVSYAMTHEIIKTLEYVIKRETPSVLMAAAAENKAEKAESELSGLPLFLSCLETSAKSDLSVAAGLFVHARMANLPTELIGPLHRNVLQDHQWICQGSNEDSKAESYDNQQQKVDFMAVKYLVFVSPCTEISAASESNTSGKSKNKKQKKGSSEDASSASASASTSTSASTTAKGSPYMRNVTHQTSNGIVFDFWEDEIFHEEGVASVLFRNTSVPSVSNKSLMVASLIPVGKHQKCVHSLMNMMP